MNNNEGIWEGQRNIEYVLNEVGKRGWTDEQLEIDDFALLRGNSLYRDAQVAILYEEYFLPRRHEYELRVLQEIIYAVIGQGGVFVAGAIVGGIVGNASYELLKFMARFAYTVAKAKLGEASEERCRGFDSLANDAEKLSAFFAKNQRARIEQIELETGVGRERAHALLKIAGFQHCRRTNACYWVRPDTPLLLKNDPLSENDIKSI